MNDDLVDPPPPSPLPSALVKGDRLNLNQTVMFCRVGDDVVILDSAGGRYYGLNEVGGAMLEGVASGKDLGEVHAALAARYEVDPDSLWKDIGSFVNRILTLQMATLTK